VHLCGDRPGREPAWPVAGGRGTRLGRAQSDGRRNSPKPDEAL